MPYPDPPDWWKPELYDYLSDMTLAGWVWEFYRRAILKNKFLGEPVNAMDPKSAVSKVDSGWSLHELECLLFRGNTLPKQKDLYDNFTSDAVRLHRLYDLGFWAQQSGVSFEYDEEPIEERGNLWAGFAVNLSYPDTVIRRQFDVKLAKARQEFPERPREAIPRVANWEDNKMLQVWDLREFGVSWAKIAKLLKLNSTQSARNALNTARRLIEEGEWEDLVPLAIE